jgi:predicted ATPase/DNA-binding SARP family transcriptional activator
LSTDTLHIQLLGAFRVKVGERIVEAESWRLRKAASLVKLLALAPAHRLTREQIMEQLWPELPPQAASNNLRRTLHEARRCLEPGAPGSRFIIPQAGHLLLSAPAGLSTDVEQFEQAARQARSTSTPEAYQAALRLYTGELLPQDRYDDWASGRREDLQQTYLSLLIAQARLEQSGGQWQAAIGACQRVIALQPTHEEAHGLLMRLHALSGHRAQALQQYQQLASTLQAELAVEPDPSIHRLRDEIAAGRFPAAARPDPAVSQPAPQPRVRTNLPHALTSFVGRRDAMAVVKQLIGQVRLLTLTGPGGSGKTRLAYEVARELVDQFAHGVWLAELAPLSDPGLVPQAVGQALGLKEQPGRTFVELLAESLAARRLLLVLDNCEHLVEAVARLADTLLRAAPRLTILSTSRQPLEVLGEAIWPVPPLDLPPADWTPAQLPNFEAVHLFTERARLVEWTFTLSSDNRAAVVEICRRLDGMPLAIELAAARLKSLTLEEIAVRLDERFALLTSGNRTALPRQQTLHAAIEWSYQLLAAGEQRLLERLAVFAGGADLKAVEAVCPPNTAPAGAVSDGVKSLLGKSLLRRAAGLGGELRVEMLETIHAFALERLTARGELAATRSRHGNHFLALAVSAEPALTGPEQTIWLERLEAEHDNLRAALAWMAESGAVDASLRLAAALWRFWLVRGHYSEGRGWCARVLALAGDSARTAVAATVLRGAGALSHRQGDHAAARAQYARGLAIVSESGDQAAEADLLNATGLVAQAQGNFAEARELYEASLALAREIDDSQGIASTLNNLGMMATQQMEYAAARSMLLESLALAQKLGNTNTAGNALNNLGVVAFHEGDYAAARDWYEQRLELACELGSRFGIASALHNLGLVAARLDDLATAQAKCAESLAISRDLGDQATTAASLVILGGIAAQQGQAKHAQALFLESLALARRLDDKYRIAFILEEVAALAAAQGQPEQAARFGGAAQALREAIHAPQPLNEREKYEAALRAAREQAGSLAWEAAWAAGRSVTLDELSAELEADGQKTA